MVQARAGASQGGQSRISLGSWLGAGDGEGKLLCLWPGVLQSPLAPGAATTLTQEHPPILPPVSSALRPPKPLCSGAGQAGLPGAYSFSCSRGSGHGPPPSWSWVPSCLSLSCSCRSGVTSSSSSRPHCAESLGDTEKQSPSAHTPLPQCRQALQGLRGEGTGPPRPCLGLSVPIFKAEVVGDGGNGALCGEVFGFCRHLTPGCLLVVEGILCLGRSNLRMGQDPLSPSSCLDSRT